MDTTDKIAECQRRLADVEGIKLKGNHYTPVKDRLRIFREVFGMEYEMRTDYEYRDESIICKSWLQKDEKIYAVGLSEVYKNSRSNKVIEMAQTVSLGLMMSALGLDGGEFASADEIAEFISEQSEQQENSANESGASIEPPKKKIVPLSKKKDDEIIKLFDKAKHLGDVEEVFSKHRDQIINNETLQQTYNKKKEGINEWL